MKITSPNRAKGPRPPGTASCRREDLIERVEEEVGVLVPEDQRRPDLENVSGRAGRAEQYSPLAHGLGYLQARSCHQRALDLARQIGSSWDEAHALAGLGRCALAEGHTAEAQRKLGQALEIFQRIGAAEAADLAVELDAMRAAGQGA